MRHFFVVTAGLAFLLSARHAYGQALPQPASNTKLRSLTYPVADLVVPVKGLDEEEGTKEDWLIDSIRKRVAADTWNSVGGPGTIQFLPMGLALVIEQTDQVHAQIRDLLETMRRVQNVEIAVEMRTIRLPAAAQAAKKFAQQACVDDIERQLATHGLRPRWSIDKLRKLLGPDPAPCHLNEAEVVALLYLAEAERRADVMQAPKIVLFNGQEAHVKFESFDCKLRALTGADLRQVTLDVAATLANVKFHKSTRLPEGSTLAFHGVADGADILFLVTPRIVLQTEQLSPPSRSTAYVPPSSEPLDAEEQSSRAPVPSSTRQETLQGNFTSAPIGWSASRRQSITREQR